MKVDHIETCICCDHESTCADSVYYGMPQLKVSGGGDQQRFTAYCPECGRGGVVEHKSAFLALRSWNKMQQRQKRIEKHGLFVDDRKV